MSSSDYQNWAALGLVHCPGFAEEEVGPTSPRARWPACCVFRLRPCRLLSQQAEGGGKWPLQWVMGVVGSLPQRFRSLLGPLKRQVMESSSLDRGQGPRSGEGAGHEGSFPFLGTLGSRPWRESGA